MYNHQTPGTIKTFRLNANPLHFITIAVISAMIAMDSERHPKSF